MGRRRLYFFLRRGAGTLEGLRSATEAVVHESVNIGMDWHPDTNSCAGDLPVANNNRYLGEKGHGVSHRGSGSIKILIIHAGFK